MSEHSRAGSTDAEATENCRRDFAAQVRARTATLLVCYLTRITGNGDSCTILVATEPKIMPDTAPNPRVPTTM